MALDVTNLLDPAEAVSAMSNAIVTVAAVSHLAGAMDRATACGYIALGMLTAGLMNVMDADYLIAALQLLTAMATGHTWWMSAYSTPSGKTDS